MKTITLLMISLLFWFFVAGFKNTDFLFFTPQFSRNFLISPPKNDSHIIKEHSFTLPKTLWWIWEKKSWLLMLIFTYFKRNFCGIKKQHFCTFYTTTNNCLIILWSSPIMCLNFVHFLHYNNTKDQSSIFVHDEKKINGAFFVPLLWHFLIPLAKKFVSEHFLLQNLVTKTFCSPFE